jgi:hypothetical protein
MNRSSRQLSFAYIVYATALVVLALVHTAHAQTYPLGLTDAAAAAYNCNPYTSPNSCTGDPTAPGVNPYGPTTPPPSGSTPYNLSSPNLPTTPGGTATMPLPSSRMLMFGNVLIGQSNQSQDYVPFLNLVNGWWPQAFLVTVITSDGVWQHTYDMPAWRHQSVNLEDCPLLKGRTSGFGVFVQAWGVATATVSLHRRADPWGPAYQTIQPDTMATPLFVTP